MARFGLVGGYPESGVKRLIYTGRVTKTAVDEYGGVTTPATADPVETENDLRTLVTVSRTHETDVRQRQVIARIDSRPKTTMYFGDSFTQEVSPGTHVLRVHNTLVWKTIEFRVEPGEHLEFVIANYAGKITLGFLALLGVAPLYLSVEQRSVA